MGFFVYSLPLGEVYIAGKGSVTVGISKLESISRVLKKSHLFLCCSTPEPLQVQKPVLVRGLWKELNW